MCITGLNNCKECSLQCADRKIKLNLGCGNRFYAGYVNVDLYNPKADENFDLTELLPYKDNSVDKIYARHIIEHFDRQEWSRVKKEWHRILKPNGTLTIECPDIVRCMKHFLKNTLEKRWQFWLYSIYGLQKDGEEGNEGQYHKNGFDDKKLAFDLREEGFEIVSVEWLWDDKLDNENGFNLKLVAKKYE